MNKPEGSGNWGKTHRNTAQVPTSKPAEWHCREAKPRIKKQEESQSWKGPCGIGRTNKALPLYTRSGHQIVPIKGSVYRNTAILPSTKLQGMAEHHLNNLERYTVKQLKCHLWFESRRGKHSWAGGTGKDPLGVLRAWILLRWHSRGCGPDLSNTWSKKIARSATRRRKYPGSHDHIWWVMEKAGEINKGVCVCVCVHGFIFSIIDYTETTTNVGQPLKTSELPVEFAPWAESKRQIEFAAKHGTKLGMEYESILFNYCRKYRLKHPGLAEMETTTKIAGKNIENPDTG